MIRTTVNVPFCGPPVRVSDVWKTQRPPCSLIPVAWLDLLIRTAPVLRVGAHALGSAPRAPLWFGVKIKQDIMIDIFLSTSPHMLPRLVFFFSEASPFLYFVLRFGALCMWRAACEKQHALFTQNFLNLKSSRVFLCVGGNRCVWVGGGGGVGCLFFPLSFLIGAVRWVQCGTCICVCKTQSASQWFF